MKLVIDIGNTCTKWGVFNQSELVEKWVSDEFNLKTISVALSKHGPIDSAILSAVKAFPSECRDLLTEQTELFIELNHQTPLPIVNRYQSPETLGLDRIAAAIGASALHPGKALLVIDAGTAITIDFVNPANEYLGGNISPGIETRFKALNHFTGKLPLISLQTDFDALGSTTESAIRAGVQQGVIFELEAYIQNYSKQYEQFVAILTGGHSAFLHQHIQLAHEKVDDLTLIGLHEILKHNIH